MDLKRSENLAVRDLLLKIGNLSKYFSIFNSLSNQGDLKQLLRHCTSPVITALNNCLVETHSTRLIKNIDWPVEKKEWYYCFLFSKWETERLTVIGKNQQITSEDIYKKYDDQNYKKIARPVRVKMVNMDWFERNKSNFITFAKIMQEKPDDLYVTEFVVFLLDYFWPRLQKRILFTKAMPHVVLTLSFIFTALLSL